MKNKIYLATIKELATDLYTCVFDSKCDIDDLMKSITKAMDFFKIYCCSIEETPSTTVKTTAGKAFMSVAFNDDTLKNADDLTRTATINKIVNSINSAVIEYQKKNTSKDLLRNCESYVMGLKNVTSLPYNFSRLNNLINIMREMINYDISHANSFNWAATSLLFHILYVNITGVINRYHHITLVIQSSPKDDTVSALSNLFQSKRQFIDLFLIDVLPKILSFSLSLDNGVIKFSNIEIPEDIASPIFSILSLYKNKELEPHHVKTYLINNSHTLVHMLTNPLRAGAPLPVLPKSTDFGELSSIVKSLNKEEKEPEKKKEIPAAPVQMPDDKNYKKIVLMKFFTLIEKCIHAYKEQKPPATAMVVNIFEGTKSLSIKDGQVLIKKT